MSPESHPLRQVLAIRDIRYFALSRFFSACSRRLLQAAISWHVYELTGSALQLGMIGLVQFLPSIPLSLVGGAIADAHDRRRIVLLSQTATFAASLVLIVASEGSHTLPLLYATILALAVASSFENPARQAMLPGMMSRSLFPHAVTLFSTIQNLAWMTGPVILGFTVAAYGVTSAYVLNAGMVALSLLGLLGVRSRESKWPPQRVSMAAIREGLSFVWSRPVIWSAMTLDMFAVIFASANALLPIFANDILGVGARGYGILSASMDLGTFAMALVLMFRRPILRPGRALLIAVGIYGLATIIFGLSRSFPLSLAAFALAGMADQVSMVTRSTLIQLSTPDELRGRVSSVNMIFINASNQLGGAESGFLAAVTSATFPTVAGGIACLGVLGIISVKVPSLHSHRPQLD